jgi:hypothetical protein
MPQNYDLSIYRGDYVEIIVTVKDSFGAPVDLTGSTSKAQLKENYGSSSAIDFTCTPTGVTGQVNISLSSADTSALTANSYIWDFQITDSNGRTRTYLAGDVVAFNEVTT